MKRIVSNLGEWDCSNNGTFASKGVWVTRKYNDHVFKGTFIVGIITIEVCKIGNVCNFGCGSRSSVM